MESDELLVVHAVPHPSAQVQRVGFPLDHPYLELCWMSAIGPTATALLRKLPMLWRVAEPARVPAGELAASLGVPARAGLVPLVVPGGVGIASIKWLGRIEAADHPLFSPWNTRLYRMAGPTYPPDSPPLGTQPVKSAFELPWDAVVPVAQRTVLHGRSWSGAAPIRHVDVSLDDDGATWRPAGLRRGIRPTWAAEAFSDLDEDVRQSTARIKASLFVPHKDAVRGFVFEVDTGRLRELA